MSLSSASFLVEYPEFAAIDSAKVSAALASALREIDADVWGDLANDGQGLLAAHKLAMKPSGQQANLRAGAGSNQTSIYWSQYEDLRRRVGTAYRVELE